MIIHTWKLVILDETENENEKAIIAYTGNLIILDETETEKTMELRWFDAGVGILLEDGTRKPYKKNRNMSAESYKVSCTRYGILPLAAGPPIWLHGKVFGEVTIL
jgi:hypothetical protein